MITADVLTGNHGAIIYYFKKKKKHLVSTISRQTLIIVMDLKSVYSMATMKCINTCSLLKQTRPTWERLAETLDRRQLHGQDALKTLSKTNNGIIIIIMCQKLADCCRLVQNIIMKYLTI